MESKEVLLQEFWDAVGLGAYSRNNWDGLSEVLRDLEWLPTEAGYVLFISGVEHVLRDQPNLREILIDVLQTTTQHWAKSISGQGVDDHIALVFETVLLVPPGTFGETARIWGFDFSSVEP